MDKHLDAETLSDYAEGLPDAHARAAADAHLAACAQCRRELAAIQAYFRDMADLEPARAPADFLSRVRARLPRPSPWERAWAALLIPFRFIPVPIAVGVLIGVTAITVYMRQGGPETRAVVPAPAAGPASGSAKPSAKDVGPAEVGSVPPAPSAKPRSAAKQGAENFQPTIPEPGPGNGAGSAFGSMDAEESPAKQSPPAAEAPARASSPGASGSPRDAEAPGGLDNPASVYMLENHPAPANPPLDKSMPVEERSAVPGQAEAAAGHAAAKRMEKAPALVPSSGYALSLRVKADTAAVLAGLRSMGVAAEPEYSSSGESGFRLIVPAPMLRELGPYLARHGVSRLEGQFPSAASDSVLSIRLQLLFPAR